MTEEGWATLADPLALLNGYNGGYMTYDWSADPAKLYARKLRLFACACAHRVTPYLGEYDFREVFRRAEKEADQGAGQLELEDDHPLRRLLSAPPDPLTHSAAGTLQAFMWLDPYRAAERAAGGAAEVAFPRDAIPALTPNRIKSSPANSELCHLLRDIFGNPFRPVAFDPEWRTSTVVALARPMYESRDFSPMPILADALQDAGCANEDILSHCRGPGPHVRGCWVVDLVLGKA